MVLKYSGCSSAVGHIAGRKINCQGYYPRSAVHRLNGWNTYTEGT